MSSAEHVVGVDVGGTSIRAALVRADGQVQAMQAWPTPSGTDAIMAAVVDAVSTVRTGGAPIAGVGVIVPGSVDPDAGIARYSANLGWRDVPLRALLCAAIDVPVAIDHDVRAAGLAEWRLGAGRGVDDCAVVMIGTGVAAAVVAGGRLLAGSGGLAGELGHMIAVPGGEECRCGQRGCVEAYASAAAISRRYAGSGCAAGLTTAEIADRVPSDPVAAQVWAEATAVLGTAIAAAVAVLDPALVVLGGGLSAAGERLAGPVRDAVADRLGWRDPVRIATSPLGGRAGVVGAALVAWRAAGRELP